MRYKFLLIFRYLLLFLIFYLFYSLLAFLHIKTSLKNLYLYEKFKKYSNYYWH